MLVRIGVFVYEINNCFCTICDSRYWMPPNITFSRLTDVSTAVRLTSIFGSSKCNHVASCVTRFVT